MAANSSDQPRRKSPGRPFQKGVSGNPSGRPKTIGEVRDLARKYTSESLRGLARLARSKLTQDAARVAAWRELLDRGWGRPMQALEVSGPDGAPIPLLLSRLSDAQLADLERLTLAATAGDDAPGEVAKPAGSPSGARSP